MSNRTVVILTEPARCELADADTLVQAVLQVQNLNKAGLGASQVLCDNPAAAMRFIEAYAKAYPELQLSSPDLPLPAQLYSIATDGRVMPVPGAAAPESAKPGEADQLYPLYVLSLGAPDALMRALQHNPFAKSDIQVIEIAPLESSASDSVSVAEAVAHEPLSTPPWGAEASAEPGQNGEILPLEELSSSGPLASVEVNLDHIEVDQSGDQKDPYNPVLDEPVVAVVTPVHGPVGAPGGGPQPSADGTSVGSIAAVNPAPQSAPDATPQSAPLSAVPLPPAGASASPPIATATPSVEGEAEVSEPAGAADAPEDTAATEPDRTSPGSSDATETPPGECEEESPEAASGADAPEPDSTSPGSSDATETPPGECEEESPEQATGDAHAPEEAASVADTAETGACATRTAASEAEGSRLDAGSFSAPGEDVRYPPNGSFAMDDDVTYALPGGSGFDMFEDFFGGSGECEVAALEGVLAGLSDAAGAFAALIDDRELVRGCEASPGADVSGLPYPDEPRAAQEDAEDQRSPAVHDLDI